MANARSRGLILGLTAAMALAPIARAVDPLVRQVEGALVLPSNEPLHLFKLTYAVRAVWAEQANAQSALAWRAKPEPLFIEARDKAKREILVRTTLRGRDLLRQSSDLKVEGPDTPADRRDCVDLFVAFKVGAAAPPLEPITARAGAFCPWSEAVDPDRHLVVEGLDGRGRRLYAVLADDPRWAIHETVDDKGNLKPLGKGRRADASTYVRFQAPDVGDRLRRLKIWQFKPDGRGAAIAQVVLK